jgi:uncharacterized protein YjbI with pentapeptide repeats
MKVEEFLEKYTAGVRNFSGIDLSEVNLSGAKLDDIDFSQANLNVINLSGASLVSANLMFAKLNVARLSGAHLSNANLKGASLNVTNLVRADLSNAELSKASLVRSELVRANLSRANLIAANLKNADLREATLRQANLRQANLSEVNLKGSLLTGANLEQANLSKTDLSRTDLSGANLRDTELKQANLSRANLSGANLAGANLRWADLTGANLRWADLTGAKLSGADLTGANLSNANLSNSTLVHANLQQARLIKTEWVGADLSGATLTGAKLYGTSRFGLKADGITCEWLDLSPMGDSSIIKYLTSQDSREFFNETPPNIRIIVDKPLDHEANYAIAAAYYQISQQYRLLKQPPSTEIGRRRTILTFRIDSDEGLLPTACGTLLPFQDAPNIQKNLRTALEMLKSEDTCNDGSIPFFRIQQFSRLLDEALNRIDEIRQIDKILELPNRMTFFQAPTQIILTNSSAQELIIHDHPNFGKRLTNRSDDENNTYDEEQEIESIPFSVSEVIGFIKGFHY